MNTRMAKRRITPMPTIVHTMLVRVGSTVCWGKGGWAGDGEAHPGSAGAAGSGEGCAGPPASGRSALMAVPLAPVWMITVASSRHIVAGWSGQLHDGRASGAGRPVTDPGGPEPRPGNPQTIGVPSPGDSSSDTRPGGER